MQPQSSRESTISPTYTNNLYESIDRPPSTSVETLQGLETRHSRMRTSARQSQQQSKSHLQQTQPTTIHSSTIPSVPFSTQNSLPNPSSSSAPHSCALKIPDPPSDRPATPAPNYENLLPLTSWENPTLGNSGLVSDPLSDILSFFPDLTVPPHSFNDRPPPESIPYDSSTPMDLGNPPTYSTAPCYYFPNRNLNLLADYADQTFTAIRQSPTYHAKPLANSFRFFNTNQRRIVRAKITLSELFPPIYKRILSLSMLEYS